MMRALSILVVLLAAAAGFAFDRFSEKAPQAATKSVPAVVIQRSPDGHFYARGTINGAAQAFLVDTGASTVTFGRAEARRFGLAVSEEDFTGSGETAAGPIRFAPVVIPRLSVGPIVADGIAGAVVDVPSLEPLLGQSFLSQLTDVTIRGDRMELR